MIALARKELRDALRNRWLIGYGSTLMLLGALAAFAGLRGSEGLALQMFGRTAATLTNLCLFLAPLVALALGAGSIAGERERRTLDYLLAQPLSRSELVAGKYLGMLAALVLATFVGFAPAWVLVATRAGAGAALHFAVFPALASLLAAALLAVGVAISVMSPSWASALSIAIFFWFVSVVMYDLLLMSVLLGAGLPTAALAVLLVANPADAVRVLVVLSLEPDLYLLGPAGAWLLGKLGVAGTAVLLVACVLAWSVAALAFACFRFRIVASGDATVASGVPLPARAGRGRRSPERQAAEDRSSHNLGRS